MRLRRWSDRLITSLLSRVDGVAPCIGRAFFLLALLACLVWAAQAVAHTFVHEVEGAFPMSVTSPKSVLRHRPIHTDAAAPIQLPQGMSAVPNRTGRQRSRLADVQPTARGGWRGDDGTSRETVRQQDRSSSRQPVADVAVEDEEIIDLPPVAQPSRVPPSRRPMPKTEEPAVQEDIHEVTTEPLDEEEYTLPPVRPARARTSARQTYALSVASQPVARRQRHWSLIAGFTLLVALGLFLLVSTAVNWCLGKQDDWTYGAITRTSQLEAVIGDHDSAAHPTHFTAINLHGQIEVIEFPGGNAAHTKIYQGPRVLWNDANKVIPTLQVRDVNGDGKPDIIVHLAGDRNVFIQPVETEYFLINTGSGFRVQN